MARSSTTHRPWTKDDACIPAPTVKDPVLAYMRQIGAPMLQRDFRPLGLPRTAVNRVLDRALKAGVVTRRQMMVDCVMPAGTYAAGTPIRRAMWLYQLVEGQ